MGIKPGVDPENILFKLWFQLAVSIGIGGGVVWLMAYNSGGKNSYLVEDVKIRIISILDQLLMKWITKEGKDMFNLQANAFDIAKGIGEDLDMEIMDSGLTITGFNIMSFNYPKEIQDMITKTASYEMIGDMSRYQQVSMTDGISSGKVKGGGAGQNHDGHGNGQGNDEEYE